jgi:hypothetical protein
VKLLQPSEFVDENEDNEEQPKLVGKPFKEVNRHDKKESKKTEDRPRENKPL